MAQIKHRLASVPKTDDNAWADVYNKDVRYLLRRLATANGISRQWRDLYEFRGLLEKAVAQKTKEGKQ